MALITAETAEATCRHCLTVLDEDSECRDSNGDRVCSICYHDGTAYVESLDYELDAGR